MGHPRRPATPAGTVEFSAEHAARRMGQLMRALDLPYAHETAEAGCAAGTCCTGSACRARTVALTWRSARAPGGRGGRRC
ncbi:hypothetical protein ACFQZ4_48185 [Catellatospora coxensis]